MWENLILYYCLPQQEWEVDDKNHRERIKTHAHKHYSHNRMIEKSKIMRKIFSHRSRHTVVCRLPYHLYILYIFFSLSISRSKILLWESIECQVEIMYEIIPITTHESNIDDHCTRNSDSILSHLQTKIVFFYVAIFIFFLQWQEKSRSLLTRVLYFSFVYLPFFFSLPWTFLWKWYFTSQIL